MSDTTRAQQQHIEYLKHLMNVCQQFHVDATLSYQEAQLSERLHDASRH